MTSGGDASGMNAAVRAIVRTGIYHGIEIIGFRKGYEGIIDNEHLVLNARSVSGIIDRGGTILETARSERFMTEEGQKKAFSVLRKHKIDGLIVIGGDGSFRGARVIDRMGISTVGVPATIDNDIAGTDYSIGFDTAINTVIDALSKIRDTATSHERVFCVEVMGRLSGEIALYAGLAGGADYILIPEIEYEMEHVLGEICEQISRDFEVGKKHFILVIAEGAGTAQGMASAITNRTHREVRISILGHLQRGGSPTALDRILASRFGAEAVEALMRGERDSLV
ncbi:6-phosphofructokinase 1, partial [Candidatus Hakubella thermalkaliphila]